MTQQGSRAFKGDSLLIDTGAVAKARAARKLQCQTTFESQSEYVEYFKNRVAELNKGPKEVVIVFINADEPHGKGLVDMFNPGPDWPELRDRGEVPFVRGLLIKDAVAEFVAYFDNEAAQKLRDTFELCVLVIDHGVAEVFPA